MIKRLNKRGDLNISFGWLFAIIVGGFILFLAIYASTKIIKTERITIDLKTAKEIGILLNPLETGFETGKVNSIILPAETRINNQCDTSGLFGKQIINLSQKSFDTWSNTDANIVFSNKYIFSEKYVEGKKFYLFSKPFKFPFKVSDLIFLTSSEDNYCFKSPPDEIKSELEALGEKNIFTADCPEDSINVCFGSGGCDIDVNYNGRYVIKNGERMSFEGDALMYAAIFSDPEIYECQLKRVMKRFSHLTLIYKDKTTFIMGTGCTTNLKSDLLTLTNLANNLESSANLGSIKILVETIDQKNDLSDCKLW